jgi:RimJ/RimL family protein N-acetyltransferase
VAELREGRPEDAGALARLWLDSARAGFAEVLDADYEWPEPELIEARTRAAMGEEGVGLIVAEGPQGVVGYVGHSPSRDPDALTGVGEIRTMFVHPSAWGDEVGSALITAAFEALRERGFAQATVWSFQANERANAFYEKHGFTRDGGRRREAVWAYVDEVRYRVGLPSADET